MTSGRHFGPEDMMRESPHVEEYTDEQIHRMWPQAEGELNGFANALRNKSGLTAAQLRMALQMARREFKRLEEATNQ